MKVLVVYESMFGKTRAVAEAIGEGLRSDVDDVDVVDVSEATYELAAGADLLVVGAPTHGSAIRHWIDGLPPSAGKVASFDTRVGGDRWWTRHVSRRLAKQLCRHGRVLLHQPSSFPLPKRSARVDVTNEAGATWGRFIRRELHFQQILESTHAERDSESWLGVHCPELTGSTNAPA